MDDQLQGATLFKLEGSTMRIQDEDYRLDTLFSENICADLGERKAVFYGERISDQAPAAIKLKFQMDPRAFPGVRECPWIKSFATDIFRREVDALKATATVVGRHKLMADDTLVQGPHSDNPHGYIHVIVTQKMPGRPLNEYHNISAGEGSYVEEEVIRILNGIYACGWSIYEGGSDEVLYDRETMTVYEMRFYLCLCIS
ncbi:hypothetical protein P170DRAFT_472397 [Aspergillus steynii IBT 23096]|uniref:Uncharacterized protein n=1 Tax=Aspergillus steynii IBT 23096 TaxID=1392250 RepID=A0A2I2GI41_9EURO|nr:uncharacterized protein P170DRAFT_472397 [Aspergillus steynii IBT 23096]PLB52507.1 hypothetical protein P170DRAFT_472397 [Aspergillus steynii IBT 23096]